MAAVLGTREAAAYVGLGVNRFRSAVNRGEIAAIRDGGRVRYLAADLDAYLQRKRVPARAEHQPAAVAQRRRSGLIQLPAGTNRITGRRYGEAAR